MSDPINTEETGDELIDLREQLSIANAVIETKNSHIEELQGTDRPWPPNDVVVQLVAAAEWLLHHTDYDRHVYEAIEFAITEAKAWLKDR